MELNTSALFIGSNGDEYNIPMGNVVVCNGEALPPSEAYRRATVGLRLSQRYNICEYRYIDNSLANSTASRWQLPAPNDGSCENVVTIHTGLRGLLRGQGLTARVESRPRHHLGGDRRRTMRRA